MSAGVVIQETLLTLGMVELRVIFFYLKFELNHLQGD